MKQEKDKPYDYSPISFGWVFYNWGMVERVSWDTALPEKGTSALAIWSRPHNSWKHFTFFSARDNFFLPFCAIRWACSQVIPSCHSRLHFQQNSVAAKRYWSAARLKAKRKALPSNTGGRTAGGALHVTILFGTMNRRLTAHPLHWLNHFHQGWSQTMSPTIILSQSCLGKETHFGHQRTVGSLRREARR